MSDNYPTGDNNTPPLITEVDCAMMSPAGIVTLHTDGSVSICNTGNCLELGNAGANTPTLTSGEAVAEGPFTCQVINDGVKCTIADGDGFYLSPAGVVRLE
jgi:hypothetical protein